MRSPLKTHCFSRHDYTKAYTILQDKKQKDLSSVSEIFNAIYFDRHLLNINPYAESNEIQFLLDEEREKEWYSAHILTIVYMKNSFKCALYMACCTVY